MAVLGFIGLGVMGREMASHLVAAGHTVQAFDLNPRSVEELRQKGAKAANNVTEAASGADVVITMLPDTPQVEDVIRQEGGILANPPAGGLFIDMSTIAPLATRRLSAELAAAGIAMLDAPVSGGLAGAKAAKLAIMVGGAPDAFMRAKPILEVMGTTIIHVGEFQRGTNRQGVQPADLRHEYTSGVRRCRLGTSSGTGRRKAARGVAWRRSLVVDASEPWSPDPCKGRSRRLPHRPSIKGSAISQRTRI